MRVTLPEQERHYEDRQIRLERRSPFYWRVTFDHPPLNIFGPETIPELNEVVTALETDEDCCPRAGEPAATRINNASVEAITPTSVRFITMLLVATPHGKEGGGMRRLVACSKA